MKACSCSHREGCVPSRIVPPLFDMIDDIMKVKWMPWELCLDDKTYGECNDRDSTRPFILVLIWHSFLRRARARGNTNQKQCVPSKTNAQSRVTAQQRGDDVWIAPGKTVSSKCNDDGDDIGEKSEWDRFWFSHDNDLPGAWCCSWDDECVNALLGAPFDGWRTTTVMSASTHLVFEPSTIMLNIMKLRRDVCSAAMGKVNRRDK